MSTAGPPPLVRATPRDAALGSLNFAQSDDFLRRVKNLFDKMTTLMKNVAGMAAVVEVYVREACAAIDELTQSPFRTLAEVQLVVCT
jgi:hypothetical protein